MIFGESFWKIIEGFMVLEQGIMFSIYYIIVGCLNMVVAADSIISLSLQYNRFGYMSEKRMKMFVLKGYLLCMKLLDLGFYESCIYVKKKRVNFLKKGREIKIQKSEVNFII